MDNKEQIERNAKNTVGYSEASSKKSFMVGVSVAISILTESHDKQIKQLTESRDLERKCKEMYEKDLITVSSIIDRYSDRSCV